jgi:hypothetical protein
MLVVIFVAGSESYYLVSLVTWSCPQNALKVLNNVTVGKYLIG